MLALKVCFLSMKDSVATLVLFWDYKENHLGSIFTEKLLLVLPCSLNWNSSVFVPRALYLNQLIMVSTHPAITCSTLTIKTLAQRVKYVPS